MFEFYKKGQGKWTRGLTMAGAVIITLLGTWWLVEHPLMAVASYFKMDNNATTILRAVGAVVFILGMGYLGFWISYLRAGTGDFFIATEGEMKKVSWSSRKEIVGSTQVVIFTLVVMGGVLFAVDLLFMLLFSAVGVLQIAPLQQLLGGGA